MYILKFNYRWKKITIFCSQCGSEIEDNAKFCNYCGNTIASQPAPENMSIPKQQAYTQTHYAPPPQSTMSQTTPHPAHPQYEKNRIVAGILGIILGTFGIHKFYLGKMGNGVMYLCFFWTGIPSLMGLVEGIMYLVESDKAFQERVQFM